MTKDRASDVTRREKREKEKDLMIGQLRKVPIVQVAVDILGISRQTHYRWLREDPAYAKQVEVAIEEGVAVISDAAEAGVIGGIKDRKKWAIELWLRANHTRYKTKVDISGTVRTGGADLTDEQRATIEEALRLAALQRPDMKKRYGGK